MKIKHPALLIPWTLSAAVIHNGYGAATINPDIGTIIQAGCTKVTCPSDINSLPFLLSSVQCATTGPRECYKSGDTTYVYSPCTSCAPGYTLGNIAISQCGPLNQMFKGCKCVCSNCSSETTYSAAGTGYQKKINRYCECSSGVATCKETTVYQCAVGYYGRSTNGTSGCTRCPASGGIYGTTAAAGSTAVTSCYIPSGTTFSDSTGSGTYTGNCYYTN